ncbi:fluoride efflux transporter CrcB [Pseudorhizobium flavum]|uniref:Fluoride-specific ion channel FluC n=1 Tax=Pseudorhizobium flavum TaxID=1335061 RepID=A0A7W9YVS0_9HYPH|nr:fluoride efflux transporter CrcB [Pseudorhizobium flavum]MBB6178061.1 CrcB protein [Pseudorhizobium flavum]CAD6615109.1 fluoride efflux transporter CrcB [Pseudorhizobium flavum]
MSYLVVFLGAGLGGAARHAVNIGAARLLGYGFPFGTLSVNVLGSLMMGLLAQAFVMRSGLPQELRLFLATGLLGGFTTFSTFSLDIVSLWERGQWGLAATYVAVSLIASVAGLFLGLSLIRLSGPGG